jgi:molybdopterin molybdotransferase
VTFELFGRPLLRALGGHRRPHRRVIRVALQDEVQLAAPLTHYLRAVLTTDADGAMLASLTGSQSSGMLTSMSSADALVVLPGDRMTVPRGTVLAAIPLDGDLGGSERFPG